MSVYFFRRIITLKNKQKKSNSILCRQIIPMNSVKCRTLTTFYGNFCMCGSSFYPVRSGAVRYKVLVMAQDNYTDANSGVMIAYA